VLPLCNLPNSGVQRERDPAVQKLESDVFSRLHTIAQEQSAPVSSVTLPGEIQIVTFEQAIRELVALKKV